MSQTRSVVQHGPSRNARQHAVVYYENPIHLAVRRSLWNAAQLIKKEMRRTVGSYGYLAALGVIALSAIIFVGPSTQTHPDSIETVSYLVLCAVGLNLANVRIERGRLSLGAIAIGAAAILTNPLDASVIGLITGVTQFRRGPWPTLGNGLINASTSCVGSIVATQLRFDGPLSVGSRVVVVVVLCATNLALVVAALRIRTGEPVASIVMHNSTPSFYAAFAYFGLAALLLSYVLNGSPTGYFLATIVCVLALALTDTIAGRRVRRVLESELSDADRHLFHSRAVEGVVHNLRNHVATAVGYLK
ncbi:MAG TPA: hypothetical protein VHW94_08000, partial [Candidatus Dormibacteraeota bacterium]|nr:hypothetical protein [Candidatus Dormibacteraeota bacterium]